MRSIDWGKSFNDRLTAKLCFTKEWMWQSFSFVSVLFNSLIPISLQNVTKASTDFQNSMLRRCFQGNVLDLHGLKESLASETDCKIPSASQQFHRTTRSTMSTTRFKIFIYKRANYKN
jgi:hypothetical protein